MQALDERIGLDERTGLDEGDERADLDERAGGRTRDVRDFPREKFLFLAPRELRCRRIHKQDAFFILDEDGRGSRLGDRAEFFLALAESDNMLPLPHKKNN